MMADPESTSCVSPSDVESISGGKGGEFEVADPFSEGTSTDLLKNTPSNIAKLEDIIEHSEGRKKYLAHTKSPSDGEDVRWYFCKVPLAENQLAASVPRTEIVGKSEYFRFGMRDSLALEASFLQCEEDLLAMWWKEYAECSEGPSGSCVSPNAVMVTQLQSSPDGKRPSIIVEDEQERVGVPVKGGLYEVDLVKRHCFPVYWHGENRRVLRGHWFACKGGHEWLPLRENVSEQLELAYRCQVWRRRSYQTSGLFAARVELQGSVQGLHALFTGEDETWEAWLASETSGFSNVISLRGNGIKLRRGYSSSQSSRPSQDELRQQKEEQADDYCSQVPVGHLVFMVHGIGQRLEKANLVDDVATFRHITSSLAERHLTAYQRSSQRVLFIPCQWRRGLKLDGESSVEKITLDGVRGLRQTLSATVHDVLYYMSPIYCQAIINSVSNQLNKLYAKFIKRNPGYGGKVSIYGHSLGSVLSYDILCHQEILSSPFPMENVCGKYGFSGNPQLCKGPVSSGFNPTPCPNDLGATKIYQAPEHVGCFLSESDCPQSDLKVHSPAISNSSMDEPRVCHGEAVDVVQMNSSVSDVRGLDENHALDNKHEHNRSSILDAKGVEEDHHSDNVYQQHDEGPEFRLKMQSEAHDGTKALVGDISVNEHDKDQLITMLTEQVILLEKRLKDLTVQQNHILAQEKKAYVTGDMISVAASRMPSSGEGSSDQDDTQNTYTPIIKYTKLDFKVDTFFAVGSPLGVFLSLRNIRIGIGEGKEYWQGEEIIEEMPACRRMFNIFHPFDPVAYRIEPLVCKEYIGKRPVIIPYHRGGKRLHIGFQEFTEDLAARSQAVLRRVNSMRIHMVNIFQPKKSIEDYSTDTNYEKNKTYGAIMMKRLTGSEEGHIDHMLQDETFQHPFILAIGSHTSYWRDFDTALFILKHLYNDIPEEPMTDPSTVLPQLANVTKTATYETDAMDQEDLPLTFSDIDLRLAFSRRARKFTAT